MMREKLMKKLQSKGKELDPLEKQAKMGVIKELSKQAGDMLGSQIHPMKKVTVASDSKEGLKEGLDKAAGLVEHANEHETDPDKLMEEAEEESGADLDKDMEEGESDEHLGKILGHMTHNEPSADSMQHGSEVEMHPDEIDAKIAQLKELKAKKLAGK